ncbi:hypothetical protein ES711_11250 [Gelidibacter salicanalis]|uniref:Uncharacterized protein n=1 Tax=Gelidibacter salicanalis TaxID=291193 RepID=A0A5C7AFL4_9FLAO|nr:hypothetical protein [Gelidibacter salicanalis]TXE07338.1 hypothetical protein ES711_11250 [Gelidibacter salicanalis]
MSTTPDHKNDKRNQPQQNSERDSKDSSANVSQKGQRTEGANDDQSLNFNHASLRDVELRWQEIESSYRNYYPNLTDEDLEYHEGTFDTVMARIAKRTNKSVQEVNDEIWEWDSDYFDPNEASNRS